MYLEDMTPFEPFLARGGRAVAVGWLASERPYPRGRVARQDLESIVRVAALLPRVGPAPAGRHECPFCVSGGPPAVHLGDLTARVGTHVLLVPDEAVVYGAPTLVVHYMDAHEYAPPRDFLAATERLARVTSLEYRLALRRAGWPMESLR